ncbi:ABC transporter substrate-binding protein [Streptomyces sp. NPDC048248]|uniref:ABC transporter substrate-binding protein n=1 Tax=Streptomyces sp. NPDC048248 TaxID=3365523 RepID=UPI0037219A8E
MASNEPDSQIPVFRGAGHLLRLIADLVRRPRRRECPEPVRHRGVAQGREGLPVVCLVGGTDHTQLAKGISYFLSHADPRRVPHCLYDLREGAAGADPESVEAVRRTLERLAQGLALSVNGSDGRVRFRRFGLVNWLIQSSAGGPGHAGGLEGNDHTLLQGLREREFRRRRLFGLLRSPETELAVDGKVPWWVWLFAVHVFPLAWFQVRRGLGREYRWLLNQPYLAPRDPGTFIGFAERLTAPHNQVEDPEQLRKLMVNAFLEDLRVAFRRRIWRPGTARRTAYCVALLDGTGTGNCGYPLLRTVIDVRNETGAFDPLLIISCGAEAPASGTQARADWGHSSLWELTDRLYGGWRDAFLHTGRARNRAPWYLPVSVPPLMPPSDDPAVKEQYELTRRLEVGQDARLRIPEPPLWARRVVSLVVACAAAVALLGTGWVFLEGERGYERAHCGLNRFEDDAATLRTASTGECIGVSRHGFTFHSPDSALNDTLEKISAQNTTADKAHKAAPERPLVTLVHLSALLSSTGRSTGQLAYVREALQGVAAAQSRQLRSTGSAEPIVRIFPANAGSGMRFGPETVEILAGLRRQDPSIVGVTGLDQSREATNLTIRKLTAVGLPMVATTPSADSLVRQSPMYFQVSPQNKREAQIAAAYADHLVGKGGRKTARQVRVVSSADPTDIYSKNLRDDVAASFRARGFEVEKTAFAPPPAAGGAPVSDAPGPGTVGQRSCSYPGVVFFAGRAEDFESMLGGINESCNSDPPALIGGDDVARLAADADRRTHYPGIPYDFLDFTLGSASCDGTSELYSEMNKLFPDECAKVANTSLDGHAALAFDAVKLFINAVKQLREDASDMPLTPPAVWHAISGVHGEGALDGESGIIGFGGDVDRQVPLDKLLSVQHIDGVGRPSQAGFCGRVGGQRQTSWCPPLEPEKGR